MLRTAAALLLLAAAARADNAACELRPGDVLHGNVAAAGDHDTISIFLPSGSVLAVDALPDKGSSMLPSLEVLDPDGAPLDLTDRTSPGPGGAGVRIRGALVPEGGGGVHRFLVTAGSGTSGKYIFRCAARLPRVVRGYPTIAPGAHDGLSIEAVAGTRMKYAIAPFPGVPGDSIHARSLRDPDGIETPLDALKGGGILLGAAGTWDLLAENDGEAAAQVAITATLSPGKSARVLYLSPLAFGPAPRVRSVAPKKVLNDRAAPGVAVTGEGFDPAATVRLERAGEDPILPSAFTVEGDAAITADFDVTGARPGAWKVVVENPSGGAGTGKLAIQSAGKVRLPPGAQPMTEVWWLDFDGKAFGEDLEAMGLGSSDDAVATLAAAAVKSYALYFARKAFARAPLTGKPAEGDVDVSFVLSPPPATVGSPGAGYDRLSIGGAAESGDPSCNPNLPWGDCPLDAGNAAYDDVSPDAGTGRGLRTRALVPTQAGSIALYYDAVQPLRDLPLASSDGVFFLKGFSPRTEEEALRYRDVAAAVAAVGKEIGGAIAHFVARAMGTADGATGLSSLPTKTGEYAALASFGFTTAEREALAASARAGLPGNAKNLKAAYFPYAEVRALLLPDAITTRAYAETFTLGGGRPDRDPSDVRFTLLAGSLPPSFAFLASGGVTGTAPLRNPDTTLVGGVYRFVAGMEDKGTGETIVFGHRINLLVDVSNPALSPLEVQLGIQKNAQTLATP